MTGRSSAGGLALVTLLLMWLALPAAADPPTGESWQVTSKMSMPGMPMDMPAQTHRVCSRPDAAPENPDPNCRNTALTRTGNKLAWRVECSGPHAMSGQGEITYSSPSAYAGTIRFESADGAMVLELSGKRVGSCQAQH
jgi:hypothetical protein